MYYFLELSPVSLSTERIHRLPSVILYYCSCSKTVAFNASSSTLDFPETIFIVHMHGTPVENARSSCNNHLKIVVVTYVFAQ